TWTDRRRQNTSSITTLIPATPAIEQVLRGLFRGLSLQSQFANHHIAHGKLLHLPGNGHRKLSHKPYVARDFEVSHPFFQPGSYVLFTGCDTNLQFHPERQLFADAAVGNPESICLRDSWMGKKKLLDLPRINIFPTAYHHVFGASGNVHVA